MNNSSCKLAVAPEMIHNSGVPINLWKECRMSSCELNFKTNKLKKKNLLNYFTWFVLQYYMG